MPPRLSAHVSAAGLQLVLIFTFLTFTYGQQAPPQQPAAPVEVFRVATELVEADVSVVDRQGRGVDNLQREDLELLVDGKPQTIAFFERVRAGSATEPAQLAAARGESASPLLPAEGGRAVLFFVDDFHLGAASLERARRVLTSYVDHDLGRRDLAAIGSASGQLGFLEQITNSATMLRSAAARLKSRAREVIDIDIPRMAPNQAQTIDRGSDRELFEFYVKETLRQNPMMRRPAAENYVTNRARTIVQQSAAVTRDTFLALERFVASKADLPGRKVIFFLSDGFLMDPSDSEMSNRMERAANIAARSGAVIYTMDARGLVTQPSYDASRAAVIDDTKAVDRSEADELSTAQDPLHRIAAETGGRAIVNTNGLAEAIPEVLKETSVYYVLAWPPDSALQSGRFHKIRLTVKGRPELRVRVPRGGYDSAPENAQQSGSAARVDRRPPAAPDPSDAVETALLAALRAPYAVAALPTSLTLGFLDLPKVGTVVTLSAQLTGESAVDIAAALFNDQGQGLSSLKEQVTLTGKRATFTHRFDVKPGLYQVRISARDTETGKVGSAMEWIEIPKLSGGTFSMSSLVVDRTTDGRAERLHFLTYIYNAARTIAPPDVVLKVQVFRDEKPVVSTPVSRLRTDGTTDLSRIPYAAELNLEGMPSGKYLLHVTATDRAAHASTSQQMNFEIE